MGEKTHLGVTVTGFVVRGELIADHGSRGFQRLGRQKLLVTYIAKKLKKYFFQNLAVTGVTV